MKVLALLVVPLPVEEPSWDTMAFGVIDEIGNCIALGFSEFSSSEFGVESKNFADEESKSSANTLDLIKSKGNGPLAIDVGVEDTMNVFEGILSVFDNQ